MEKLLKKHADKFRFAIVGGLSTVIDFGVLFVLVALGLPAVGSNFISTSIASVFNFLAHKSFTYKDSSKITGKHVISYLIVTLFGIWVIQPVVIIATAELLTGNWSTKNNVTILTAKLLATVATTIWNYFLYRKFVYQERR